MKTLAVIVRIVLEDQVVEVPYFAEGPDFFQARAALAVEAGVDPDDIRPTGGASR
jgi:hypothetical protein